MVTLFGETPYKDREVEKAYKEMTGRKLRVDFMDKKTVLWMMSFYKPFDEIVKARSCPDY